MFQDAIASNDMEELELLMKQYKLNVETQIVFFNFDCTKLNVEMKTAKTMIAQEALLPSSHPPPPPPSHPCCLQHVQPNGLKPPRMETTTWRPYLWTREDPSSTSPIGTSSRTSSSMILET